MAVDYLIITKAYLESDIIWENLRKNQIIAIVKRAILFLLLFLVSITLLTPTYFVGLLTPMKI